MGQFTPGPVLTTATFIGYQLKGISGAIWASVGMFLPSFFLVGFLVKLIPLLRRSKLLSGFLDAVNACAVGIMIAATFQLGYEIGGQWQSMVLMGLSIIAVLRFSKLSAFWIIIGGGLLGYLLLLILLTVFIRKCLTDKDFSFSWFIFIEKTNNMDFKKISTLSFIFFISVIFSGFIITSDWFLLKSEDQGYQIEFPKEPSENVQTVNTEAGPVDMHIHMLDLSKKEEDSNLIYLSSYAQYPDTLVHSDRKEQLAGFFKETIDGLVSSIDGKRLDEKMVQLGEYQGKEVKINFQDGMAIIRIRVYLVENRVYMLQVVTKTENDSNESISRFMNSFALID